MATALTLNPQKITLADTNELELNFGNILEALGHQNGHAVLSDFSAATQINANGTAITASSGSYSSGTVVVPLKKGYNLRVKGSASATFNIIIVGP